MCSASVWVPAAALDVDKRAISEQAFLSMTLAIHEQPLVLDADNARLQREHLIAAVWSPCTILQECAAIDSIHSVVKGRSLALEGFVSQAFEVCCSVFLSDAFTLSACTDNNRPSMLVGVMGNGCTRKAK